MRYLYLMRHGQTLFNETRKIQGWCDAPLTKLGIMQAKVAGEYFSKNHIIIDRAFSSTSERACDTAEIVLGHQNYTRTKGLKEWNFGTLEGESEDLNPPIPYGDFFKQYNGEGEMEMRERVAKTLEEIMSQTTEQNVLAVSHGAACRGFMRYWEKNQKVHQKERLKNCCILKFEYVKNEFSLIEIINHDF